MNKVLAFAAIVEAATGLALLVIPSVVGQLLLGAELTGLIISVGRVTGIALIASAVGCRLLAGTGIGRLLTYSALVTVYLAYLGIAGVFAGILLWPAVVLHAILTFFLARLWFKPQRGRPA
jgi:hypothetical protein